MLRRLAFVLAATFLQAGNAHAISVATDPKQAPSGTYEIEPRHTQVVFAIAHFGLTDFYGRFDKVSGELNFDPADPTKSTTSIDIDTSSLDTPNAQLNSELQGTATFDTAHFPSATFKSTSVTRTGPNAGKIAGDLTIKGITKPVILDVVYNGGLQSPLGGNAYLVGFHATTSIKRSDFNMTGTMWSSLVGDDVKLTIEALFVQSKD
jgi:polyisoprenoid-binding protein YceI